MAGWIKSVTGRECVLLDNPWKPTCQLQGCLVYNEEEINRLRKIITVSKSKIRVKSDSSTTKNAEGKSPLHIQFEINMG